MARTELHRLQFAVDDDIYKELVDLKERSNANSFADLFRKAMIVYNWVVTERRQRKEIFSREIAEEGENYLSENNL